MRGLVHDVTSFEIELTLKLADNPTKSRLLRHLNVPPSPSIYLNSILDLCTDGRSGLAHVHNRHSQVQECVLKLIQGEILVLEQLQEFNRL